MNSPRTRQTLLEKLRDKYDENSWLEFQSTYGPYILRILRALKMNSHDCEDLQQNIMLIAWKSLPKFNYMPEKGSFRAWISTVTRRECGHFIKKRQKTFVSINEQEADRLKQALNSIDSPEIEKNIILEWEKFISEKAWENIKDKFSEKVLSVFKRISIGEDTTAISLEMDISESSVYVYKKRVLNTLQKEILRLNQELS